MVMNINKSLYVMFKSSLYWCNHLKGGFEERGFKLIPLDTCMFYVRCAIALINVDDVLLFGPDRDNIDEVIK